MDHGAWEGYSPEAGDAKRKAEELERQLGEANKRIDALEKRVSELESARGVRGVTGKLYRNEAEREDAGDFGGMSF